MLVMYVERVEGDYTKPEIIDLEAGGGCLIRLHESDLSEDGAQKLTGLFTEQAQRWALRPPGSPLGPVIPVRWERLPDPPGRLSIVLEDCATSITYTVDPSLLSQRAADHLSQLNTARSPYWQRVPKGYHDGDTGAE